MDIAYPFVSLAATTSWRIAEGYFGTVPRDLCLAAA